MHILEWHLQLVWYMNLLESFSEQPHRKQGDAHGFQAGRPIGIEDKLYFSSFIILYVEIDS